MHKRVTTLNKQSSYLCGFILFLFPVFSCTRATAQTERPELTNPALDQKLARMLKFTVPLLSIEELQIMTQKERIFIFDTREQKEYHISHIPNAQYLGYNDFKEEKLARIPKEATIVVYCSVGYRSEKIGERLISKGFTKVFNLYGSIFEWADQGLPLEDANRQPTNKLHTYNKEWGKWIKGKEIHKIW